MKINKKGRVKTERSDVRIGNFVFSYAGGVIRIRDIGGIVSHSVSVSIPKGQFLKMAWDSARKGEEEGTKFLQSYAAVMMNILCCIPLFNEADGFDYLGRLNETTIECVNRGKEIYGIKDDVSDEEDAKVLQEERELEEAIDEARKEMGKA